MSHNLLISESLIKRVMSDLRLGKSYIKISNDYALESLVVNRKDDTKHTAKLALASETAGIEDIEMLFDLFYQAETFFDLDFRIIFDQKAGEISGITVLVRVGNDLNTDQTSMEITHETTIVEGEEAQP
jgi:hypothetical protein